MANGEGDIVFFTLPNFKAILRLGLETSVGCRSGRYVLFGEIAKMNL